jgi:hypothetical protein
MKCMHEIEWDTCFWCRTPSHYDQGDRVYKTWLLCGQHDLATPEAEVEACIWCHLANVKVPE